MCITRLIPPSLAKNIDDEGDSLSSPNTSNGVFFIVCAKKERGKERGRKGDKEGKGKEGKEGKGKEGKGREGKGKEGKGREGKGREGKGRERKGKERK